MGREGLNAEQRIDLLERDMENHAKTLSEIVTQLSSGFNVRQQEQLRVIVQEGLGEIGVRLDVPDHVDAMREDFRFLRKLRESLESASKKIGNVVLLAVVMLVIGIFALGFWDWIAKHLGLGGTA